jgi:hypothetical protein
VPGITSEEFEDEVVQTSFREGVAFAIGVDSSQVIIIGFYNTEGKQTTLVVNYQVIVGEAEAASVTETLTTSSAAVSTSIEAELVENNAPITSFQVDDDVEVTEVTVTTGEGDSGPPMFVCEYHYSDDNCQTLVSSSCSATNGLSCDGSVKPGWDTVCADGFDDFGACCEDIDGASFKATCEQAEETQTEYEVCTFIFADTECGVKQASDCMISTVSCDELLNINLSTYQQTCLLEDWEECCDDVQGLEGVGSFMVTCEEVGGDGGTATGSSSALSGVFALFVAAIIALVKVF